MDNRAPSMMKAAMIGGGAAGIASSIPLVGAINCACCALVIGGGFLAGFLQSKENRMAGLPFKSGDGAKVGFFATPFFALGWSILGFLLKLVMPSGEENVAEVVNKLQDAGLDPETIEMIESVLEMMAGSGGIIGILLGFVFYLVIGAIFCTIGGLIAGSVFKHEPAGSSGATIDVEPTGGESGEG